MTRGELIGWSIPVSVATVSLVLALTLPAGRISWSAWVYFSMALLVSLLKFLQRKSEAEIIK
jgi:hypothetical protein